jgi:predicted TIM-barrel fold metal-dependent hydrolase
MYEYEVVSADAHIEAPPTRWTDRLPAALRDQAPTVVEMPDGGQGVALGDERVPLGLTITGGLTYDQFRQKGLRYDDDPPGTGQPAQRIAEQDRDGVDAEVLFSTVIATMFTKMQDPELIGACVRAYNDWLDEFCSYDPDRLFGIALMPFNGVRPAVEELERVAAKPGIRGVHLLKFPSGDSYLSREDDEFWSVANDLSVPIIAHHNFGGDDKAKSHPMSGMKEKALEIAGGADLAMFAWLLTCDLPMPTLPILTVEQLFLSGTLDKYPNLRFHFAETGIGWLPYWLEQMEDRFDRHRFWANVELPRRPLQYFRDHFTFSFQEDHAGVALRHSIGIDNICWANDFPHSVGDWPWSNEVRARQFNGLPIDEVRKIQGLNIAAQLGVITPAEKAELAARPLKNPLDQTPPTRGARRIPAGV